MARPNRRPALSQEAQRRSPDFAKHLVVPSHVSPLLLGLPPPNQPPSTISTPSRIWSPAASRWATTAKPPNFKNTRTPARQSTSTSLVRFIRASNSIPEMSQVQDGQRVLKNVPAARNWRRSVSRPQSVFKITIEAFKDYEPVELRHGRIGRFGRIGRVVRWMV